MQTFEKQGISVVKGAVTFFIVNFFVVVFYCY